MNIQVFCNYVVCFSTQSLNKLLIDFTECSHSFHKFYLQNINQIIEIDCLKPFKVSCKILETYTLETFNVMNALPSNLIRFITIKEIIS